MWMVLLLVVGIGLHSGVMALATGESYNNHRNQVNGISSNEVNGANGRYVCPGGFVRSGNSCYYLSATMDTWQNAHFDCRDRGADLACMEKRWEDKNMRAYLNRPELAPVERWIGGIYNWQTKGWFWGTSAKPLNYQGFSRRKPYENNNWHCIVMDPNMMYRWAARSCVLRKHYICEKRLKSERLRSVPTAEVIHQIPSNNVLPLQPPKPTGKKPRGGQRRTKAERLARRERRIAKLREQELAKQREQQLANQIIEREVAKQRERGLTNHLEQVYNRQINEQGTGRQHERERDIQRRQQHISGHHTTQDKSIGVH